MNIVSPEHLEGDYEVRDKEHCFCPCSHRRLQALTNGLCQVCPAAFGYQWTEGVLQGPFVDCGTCDKPMRRVPTLPGCLAPSHCKIPFPWGAGPTRLHMTPHPPVQRDVYKRVALCRKSNLPKAKTEVEMIMMCQVMLPRILHKRLTVQHGVDTHVRRFRHLRARGRQG